MVDLEGQYLKIKEEIDTAIQEVIDSASFINGSAVYSFQKDLEGYLEIPYVIPCANGTDALQIAFMALDLQPGDEVITTPFTFFATAEVIELLHLKPVFVDVDPSTFNMDTSQIEKVITEKTKVILPVHLFGQSCNMHVIKHLAKIYNLYVIEDACQSLGADYVDLHGIHTKLGTIGNIGCTSFFPSKNLGCLGDGGALFTSNETLAKKCKMIANHGSEKKYYHDMIGVNSRLDSIQAAILNVKLSYLDDYNSARQKAAQFYTHLLHDVSQIKTPALASFSTHIFHQYTLIINDIDRDELQQKLKKRGIPSMVYYPIPLHLQKAFQHWGYQPGDFPISESLATSVLSLPMHTELTEEQQVYIVESLKSIVDSR
jgi:dTDP-4-amino-4,6-dideoxygalactose transaminase